jgi:hypothetical protein
MKTGTEPPGTEENCNVYDSGEKLTFLRFGWSIGMCIADADSGAVARTDSQGVMIRTRYLIIV